MSKHYQLIAVLLFCITPICGNDFHSPSSEVNNLKMNVQNNLVIKKENASFLKNNNRSNYLKIEDQGKTKIYMVVVIGFTVLVLLLAIRTYNRLRLKKKKCQILEEKNKQLREANERLRDSEYTQRELNSTKDKFFSIIAHDLKNPFQALFSISEVLYRNIDNMDKEEINEYCKSIYESSNNLYNLLENLLQWSRTQLGNLKLNPQSLNIKEISDKITDLLSIGIEEKEIRVNNEVDDTITAFVDKNVLETILRNILNNAIKFTEERGTITIQAETENDRTLITITDTGQGIPKEHLDNLFKTKSNYYDKSTSDEQGTGLGLILCKELVEKSRGKIWAESKVGEGSTFKFTLPRKK